MTARTLTALFDRYDKAAQAVSKLEAAGIPHGDISLVGNNADGGTGAGTASDHAASGAGTGATIGTLIGGGAGLLAGLGLMAIPGVGPVVAAGWLVATLTGAGVGAAAGGLTGSLTGAGVSEQDARAYAEGVRRGGTLLTVRVDEGRSDSAVRILEEHGALDLDASAEGWQRQGWTGVEPSTAGGETTLGDPDSATGSATHGGDAGRGSPAENDTRLSGARRVRIYDHPI